MPLESALTLVGDAEDLLVTLKSDLATVASDEGVSATLDVLVTVEAMTQAIREALLRERARGGR